MSTLEPIFGNIFDWDKTFYSFLRGEKDMMPYSIIRKSESEVLLVHNIVGINKEDLDISIKTENGEKMLYIIGQSKDELTGKKYDINSRFRISTGNKIIGTKSSVKNGLLYITLTFDIEPDEKIVID